MDTSTNDTGSIQNHPPDVEGDRNEDEASIQGDIIPVFQTVNSCNFSGQRLQQ